MKAKEFDLDFDQGKDVRKVLDLSEARRPNREQKRISINLPTWMIERLDKEARRLGVTLQVLIKMCVAERLGQSVSNRSVPWSGPRPGKG